MKAPEVWTLPTAAPIAVMVTEFIPVRTWALLAESKGEPFSSGSSHIGIILGGQRWRQFDRSALVGDDVDRVQRPDAPPIGQLVTGEIQAPVHAGVAGSWIHPPGMDCPGPVAPTVAVRPF